MNYANAYILVKGTISFKNTAAQDQSNNAANKKVIFKNCPRYSKFRSNINNVVMPMYNLIEYSDNYSKKSELLWQYCRDEPALDGNDTIANFTEANAITDSFKMKEKITRKTGDDGTKKV